MKLNKYNVIVDCEHCLYQNASGKDGFNITVPIVDVVTGTTGSAKLHCIVTADHHSVELIGWEDADHDTLHPPEDLQSRISAALDSVADHRVCGNQHICPAEVVRIVKDIVCHSH